MDQYVTGSVIRRLREERRMTQSRLAELLGVSDKAVSRWETGRGYPDITLIEPLADALGISVIELLSGTGKVAHCIPDIVQNAHRVGFRLLVERLYHSFYAKHVLVSIASLGYAVRIEEKL